MSGGDKPPKLAPPPMLKTRQKGTLAQSLRRVDGATGAFDKWAGWGYN